MDFVGVYGQSDIPIWISIAMILVFLSLAVFIIARLFKTSYKLKP